MAPTSNHHSTCLLLSLFMAFQLLTHNIISVTARKASTSSNSNASRPRATRLITARNTNSHQRYGIFPRGGAVEKRYTNFLQIAQKRESLSSDSDDVKVEMNLQMKGEEGSSSSSSTSMTMPRSTAPAFRRRAYYNRAPSATATRRDLMNVSTIARPRAQVFSAQSYSQSSQQQQQLDQITNLSDELNMHAEQYDEDANTDMNTDLNTHSRLPYILTRKQKQYPLHLPSDKDNIATEAQTSAVETNTNENKGNPIIYRYFGRSRARSNRSEDTISFIVLGPSADHWKIVGKILAARGFNVIVCERTKEHKKNGNSNDTYDLEEETEGELLTQAVLNALKWQKAILVGCDEEAVLAMDAAAKLAPDRVAGLVLCGDLSHLQRHVQKEVKAIHQMNMQHMNMQELADSAIAMSMEEDVTVDSFLEDYIECPSSIIWDGDASSWSTSMSTSDDYDYDLSSSSSLTTSSSSKAVDGNGRNVIIGGGLAPHRRLPEQFAWTLTRFVESRVSSPSPLARSANTVTAMEQLEAQAQSQSQARRSYRGVWRDILPPGITEVVDDVFAPGSLLVTGRVIATAIIYLSITRVSLFQYHNIRDIRSAILNPANMKKLLALPGMLLRNRNRRLRLSKGQDDDSDLLSSTRSRRTPKDLSLEEMLPDIIDENEKLEAEVELFEEPTTSEENDVDIQEEAKTETHTDVTPKEPKSSPFPIPHGSVPHQLQPPTHTQPIEPDFDHDKKKHLNLHKFFFDQIVS